MRDHFKTLDIHDLFSEESIRQERARENSYRRGWHHGWCYAVTIIFDALLSQGYSIEDANRLVSEFETHKIMPWRQNRTDTSTPPTFAEEDYQQVKPGKEPPDVDDYDDEEEFVS